ncbi:MAG TPA: PRC-barrel domain-containing protein [Chloroflexota bacterium]|nr:PRC-barrel domain-containing protein [Chloroflexota bacterium]
MKRSSELRGLAVVDLDAAEKVGTIDEVILDPESARVAGLVATSGHGLLGGGKQTLIPASSVFAIGTDALTVRSMGELADTSDLASFPRLSQFTNRKMVTFGGTLVGTVSDVLIDLESGRIIGYAFEEHSGKSGIEGIFGGRSERPLGYVRANANLRVGQDLITVPDDAVVHGDGAGDDGHWIETDGEIRQPEAHVRWTGVNQGLPRTVSDDLSGSATSERETSEPTRVLRTSSPDSSATRPTDSGDVGVWEPRTDRESGSR